MLVVGTVYCLLSAAGFGALAVFGKLAFGAGVSVESLLLVRFGLAAAVLLAIALARGALHGLTGRAVLIGLGMGAIGYALQSGLYLTALTRTDASMVALIFYLYPVLVMSGAIALRRERSSRRKTVALAVALAGIGFVLAGAAAGRFDATGALLAAGAALTYTGYILVGDRATTEVPPLALSALVCTGAFGTFLVTGSIRESIDLGFDLAGWGWLVAVAVISTVAPILLFFAGLVRVGPGSAAILSILEPVVTVGSAALLFGETSSPAQLVGAGLVLGAVVLTQARTPGPGHGRAGTAGRDEVSPECIAAEPDRS